MKKIVAMLLAFVLLLGLCACGKEEPAPTEVQINAQPKVEATAAPQETAAAEAPEAPAGEPTEAVIPDVSMKELAESCVEKNVSELYALIGEPESADYAPSCLVEGEDGMLYYDGFVVYTTREGDVETVYYVE